MTVLHVAAMKGQTGFLEKLLDKMKDKKAVASQDRQGYTALHYAAIDGNLRAVKALVKQCPDLMHKKNEDGFTPLLCAASFASRENQVSQKRKLEEKEVIWYLSFATPDDGEFSRSSDDAIAGAELIRLLIFLSFCDISLYMMKGNRFPSFANNCYLAVALEGLAGNPGNFPSGSGFGLLERFVCHFVNVELQSAPPSWMTRDVENTGPVGKQACPRLRTFVTPVLSSSARLFWRTIERLVPYCVEKVRDAKLRHRSADELLKYVCTQLSQLDHQVLMGNCNLPEILDRAAECGTVEVIEVCFQFFPEMIWNERILESAVLKRQEKVVNLINNFCGRSSRMFADNLTVRIRDKKMKNFLHSTAKLAPLSRLQSLSGSAFQLQRELQWFKEMEKLVNPKYVAELDEMDRTPWEAFLEEHKELIEKGEQWMKDTSNYSMVVSALITTVVFAAAFTVPGGQNGEGIPVFSGKNSFKVFAISDAAALFSSIIAILMFLSVLTSRFAPEDFLKSLPKRLIFGLASLFFSIAALMVAFGATLTIVLRDTWTWVAAPVTLLASLPVIMFVWLQLPLFVQMVRSTFGNGIFLPEDIW